MPTIKTQYGKFNDFSYARNKSLDMAEGEYCVVADTDDICNTPVAMRDLIFRNQHIDTFKCKVISHTEQRTQEIIIQNRLFRRKKNNKQVYFTNKCHEDISYSMNELDYLHAFTDMTFSHYG